MEVFAVSRSVRIAPRKVRLIADAIRKMPLDDAKAALILINKRGAVALNKTLKSAIANAINNSKLNERDLQIKAIEVTEAASYKRFRPSTRGRVHPYKRRGSNIKIVLSDGNIESKNLKIEEKTVISADQKKTKEAKDGTKS